MKQWICPTCKSIIDESIYTPGICCGECSEYLGDGNPDEMEMSYYVPLEEGEK